jgi:hypothetical protein
MHPAGKKREQRRRLQKSSSDVFHRPVNVDVSSISRTGRSLPGEAPGVSWARLCFSFLVAQALLPVQLSHFRPRVAPPLATKGVHVRRRPRSRHSPRPQRRHSVAVVFSLRCHPERRYAVIFAFRCHSERSEESLFQRSREPYCRSQRRTLACAVAVRCHPDRAKRRGISLHPPAAAYQFDRTPRLSSRDRWSTRKGSRAAGCGNAP